jgi:hypothetical protein
MELTETERRADNSKLFKNNNKLPFIKYQIFNKAINVINQDSEKKYNFHKLEKDDETSQAAAVLPTNNKINISNTKKLELSKNKKSILKINKIKSSIINSENPPVIDKHIQLSLPTKNNTVSIFDQNSFPLIGVNNKNILKEEHPLGKRISDSCEIIKQESEVNNNQNNKIIDHNYFNSFFETIKNLIGEMRKNLNLVSDDANTKISKEKKNLDIQVEIFLKKAKKNYDNKLFTNLEELKNMLMSINSFNHEIVKTYEIVKRKMLNFSIENNEMKMKIKKLGESNETLIKEYKNKKYLKKKLVESINPKKKQNINKNLLSDGLDENLHSEQTTQLEENSLLNIKSEKIKTSLSGTAYKLKLKTNKLRENLKNYESEIYHNEISNRVYQILNEFKKSKKDKEDFNFLTTVKSFNQESKKNFHTIKTIHGNLRDFNYTPNKKHESFLDAKCLIDLIVKDDTILKNFHKNKKLNLDIQLSEI